MVFTQEFEFCFQIFIPLVLKILIFEISEAPLSSIWKNWQKSLFFHEYLPKGLTNFGCSESKLHTLNYHNWRGLYSKLLRCRTLRIAWGREQLRRSLLTPTASALTLMSMWGQWLSVADSQLYAEGIKPKAYSCWISSCLRAWTKVLHLLCSAQPLVLTCWKRGSLLYTWAWG